MYHVSAQGVDERMINVHDYYSSFSCVIIIVKVFVKRKIVSVETTYSKRIVTHSSKRIDLLTLLSLVQMWTNDKALKDLEYSQRRKEKKQRRRERREDARNWFWKKLYVPAVVGMVGGSFLTLCATLQSLGGDTFLWNARGTLVIVGPAMLGIGFLCLMLAAGCTFRHDQEVREKPKGPPSEFLLYGFQWRDNFSGPSTALRSISVDTGDMPLPDDLDPSRNFVLAKPGLSVRGRSDEKGVPVGCGGHGSVSNAAFLVSASSYSSTASWVHSVPTSHSQQRAMLTRQSSDSNLLSSSGRCDRDRDRERDRDVTARRSLVEGSSEVQERHSSGSHSDLHVVYTRSLTSSGYQSASDSTTGTTECQVSSESGKGVLISSASASLVKHPHNNVQNSSSGSAVTAKTSLKEPRRLNMAGHNAAAHRLHGGPANSGQRQIRPGPVRQCVRSLTSPPSETSSFRTRTAVERSPSPTKAQNSMEAIQFKHKRNQPVASAKNNLSTSGEVEVVVLPASAAAECLNFPKHESFLKHGEANHAGGCLTEAAPQHPFVLEPVVYTAGTVRCTDL